MNKSRELLVLSILLVNFGAKAIQAQPITPANDGTGTIVTSPQSNPNQFDIQGGTQAGNNLFHSLQKLSLQQGQSANFVSNPNIQNILGRIVGGNASVIDGLIKVTGGQSNLYLINPAGIYFGPNSQLMVPGSFNATTANGIQIDDYWFKAIGSNNYTDLIGNPNGFAFTTDRPGSIINEGNLTVPHGEIIRLVGGTVVNTGTVSTPGGDITIAAVPGENLVRISPKGSILSLDLPVETKTQLNADNQLLNPLSLPQLLTGGDLNHASDLVVENGVVKLRNSETIIPHDPGTAIASGDIDASSSVVGETGGTVNVLGDQVGVISGKIDVSGINGGGTALIGGDYKGKGTVPNAERTYISRDSVIKADALTDGNGGRIIAWADGTTGFYGNISARGGAESGDGGFVEVSGKEKLIFRGDVDVSAVNGSFGTLLLDPRNITIIDGSGGINDSELDDSQILQGDSPEQDFTISEEKLESLSGDVDVILEASNNITIEDLSDDVLGFAEGTTTDQNSVTSITFTAGGNFSMNPDDTIFAPGREVTIEAASIVAGDINTADDPSIFLSPDGSLSGNRGQFPDNYVGGGSVILTANNGSVTAGRISATANVNLTAESNLQIVDVDAERNAVFGNSIITIRDPGDITVKGVEIIFRDFRTNNDFSNDLSEFGLTGDASGLFQVTDMIERSVKPSDGDMNDGDIGANRDDGDIGANRERENRENPFRGSILLIDGAFETGIAFEDLSENALSPKLSITHGGIPVTIQLDTNETLTIQGGSGIFGFVSGFEEIRQDISGTRGEIVTFRRRAVEDSDLVGNTAVMPMFTASPRLGSVNNPGELSDANLPNNPAIQTEKLQGETSPCDPDNTNVVNQPSVVGEAIETEKLEPADESAKESQGVGKCQTPSQESGILQVEGFDVPTTPVDPTTEEPTTPDLGLAIPSTEENSEYQ